jgi:hypothetical protein
MLIFSLFKAFQRYITEFGSDEIEEAIINPNIYTPQLIARWIHHKCEKPNPGDPSTSGCEGLSFSHALKMRAAVSYHYAQDERRGSEKWHRDNQGAWLGNPALSHTVSRYMISLQRRKVQFPICPNPEQSIWTAMQSRCFRTSSLSISASFPLTWLLTIWVGKEWRHLTKC